LNERWDSGFAWQLPLKVILAVIIETPNGRADS
jgi:hypothetical protein